MTRSFDISAEERIDIRRALRDYITQLHEEMMKDVVDGRFIAAQARAEDITRYNALYTRFRTQSTEE